MGYYYISFCLYNGKVLFHIKGAKLIIIFFIILNFALQYVYAQRRALVFGEMWRGLYTPVIYSLYYSNDDLKIYLKHIDADGDVSGYGYPSN